MSVNNEHLVIVSKAADGNFIVEVYCSLSSYKKYLGNFPDPAYAFEYAQVVAKRLGIEWENKIEKKSP